MDVIALPPRPSIEQYRKRAKDLAKAWKSTDPDAVKAWASDWLHTIVKLREEPITDFVRHSLERAVDTFTEYLRWKKADQGSATLADAQFVIARAHGFASWATFVEHVDDLTRPTSERSVFEQAADAVVNGDVHSLRALLAAHPGLARERSSRSHRATLLHYIAANGVEDFRQKSPANAVEIAAHLLDAGAEVDAAAATYGGGTSQTTMNLLVSSTHPANTGVQVPLVHLLLDRGAAINGVDDDSSPLLTALAFGYRPAMRALVERGARVDQLITAAALGRLDLLRQMIADKHTLAPGVVHAKLSWVQMPDSAAESIERAAAWAAMYGQSAVVNWLLDMGVSPRASDSNRMSLLHWAAANGDGALVNRLVAAGADLEMKNAWGGTVLDSMLWFALNDPRDGVDYVAGAARLLGAGADPKAVSPNPTGVHDIDRLLKQYSAV